MSARQARDEQDWTTGPAKWAAVILLSLSSVVGLGWSMLRSPPRGSQALAQAAEPPPAPAAPPHASPVPPVAASPSAFSPRRLINLNTATAAELELLPGVGPAVAQRIIDHRAAHGPFKRVEDLDNVKGIGPRTLDKLRDLVTVN